MDPVKGDPSEGRTFKYGLGVVESRPAMTEREVMKKLGLTLAAAAAAFASPSYAAITIGAVAGNAVYSGPTPTYDFESPAPVSGTGDAIVTGSTSPLYAQPLGSTGNYWAIGPFAGSPAEGILDLSSFAQIGTISFIWGSVDAYNVLEVLGLDGVTAIATFDGSDVVLPPDGDQVDPAKNPLVTLTFNGGDEYNVTGLRLISKGAGGVERNAFEIDNVAIAPVPEPATWAMMMLGFGAVGFAMRRRQNTRVSFA